jgi:hypothetical protein
MVVLSGQQGLRVVNNFLPDEDRSIVEEELNGMAVIRAEQLAGRKRVSKIFENF